MNTAIKTPKPKSKAVKHTKGSIANLKRKNKDQESKIKTLQGQILLFDKEASVNLSGGEIELIKKLLYDFMLGIKEDLYSIEIDEEWKVSPIIKDRANSMKNTAENIYSKIIFEK